jgi:ketosteroid isomerase-like protein
MIGKNIAAAGLAVVLGVFTSGGQPSLAQPSGSADRVHELMTRMEQALGGETALADLTGLAVTASCSGPDGAFETEVTSFRPHWVRFRQTRGDAATEIWSGPERTWGIDTDGQIKDYGPGVRSFVRGHEFHFLLFELATRFTDHRMGPATTIRDQPCTTILMKDDMGQDASICLDKETHLPVTLELNPEGAAGAVRIYFENWESKAGVLFFYGFDLTEGSDRTFRYDYQSIEPNVASALQFVEPSPHRHDDQSTLLAVLEDERRAHLETDVARLVANIADELLDVSSGAIYRRTRSDVQELFEQMFAGATYQRWEDTEPPRVKISADGSLAWVTRRVAVRRSSVNGDGVEQRTSFVCAYSSTYEKHDDRWKMTSVTSTFLSE